MLKPAFFGCTWLLPGALLQRRSLYDYVDKMSKKKWLFHRKFFNFNFVFVTMQFCCFDLILTNSVWLVR